MTQIDIPSFDFNKFKSRFITSDFLPFRLSDGFKIFKIQDVIRHLKFPLPLHRTDYYDILFITSGSNSIKNCGLRKYEIQPGNIFFKPAGQITSGDVFGDNVEGYFCLLEADFLSKHGVNSSPLNSHPFFKYSGNPIIDLSADELDKFEFLFQAIHKNYYPENDHASNYVIIASYINVILQEAAAIHSIQHTSNKLTITSAEQLADKFKDLVSEHYLLKREVSQYAEMLYVSPNHLNKTIKSATGKTASMLIAEMLIIEAKLLLKQTNMNIAEIAYYLRFQDTSYFTRFFRKHVRATPTDFRKME